MELVKRLLIGSEGRRGILAPVPLANMKLGPEDELSVKVNCFMKDMLAQGRFRGLFFHVGNESGERGNKVATMRRQQKKKALGMVPGAHDWLVAWSGGSVVVELKAARGRLTDSQEDFAAWAEWAGVPARVARSVEEFEGVLVEVGAMSPPFGRQDQTSAAAQRNCSANAPDHQPFPSPSLSAQKEGEVGRGDLGTPFSP